MPVHDVAASGFDARADAYERARPSYPPDAVDWFTENLRIGPGVQVVDLAAGTGKFTRLLAPYGSDPIAVEPVEGMARHLRGAVPDVPLGDRPGFGPLHEATFAHEHLLSPGDVVTRVQSVSHVAVLTPAERDRVLDDVRTLLATHPETKGRDVVAMTYRVDAYRCEARS
jgi:SAM-dependent methyltransferase